MHRSSHPPRGQGQEGHQSSRRPDLYPETRLSEVEQGGEDDERRHDDQGAAQDPDKKQVRVSWAWPVGLIFQSIGRGPQHAKAVDRTAGRFIRCRSSKVDDQAPSHSETRSSRDHASSAASCPCLDAATAISWAVAATERLFSAMSSIAITALSTMERCSRVASWT